ncbi:transcriptional regulator, partial [Escherichia coli]|nr:transcriptional regulator [Escherichia coli]
KPRDDKMELVAKTVFSTPAYLDYGVGLQTNPQNEFNKDTVIVRQIEAFASAGNGYVNNPYPEVVRSIEIPQERVYELFGRSNLDGV